jgi:hypothetical protein
VRPAQKLAAWLYERPQLRRAWKICCALWFGAAWALVVAPAAAADYSYSPTGPSIATGQVMMAWTGLRDTYGVPVADYFVSTVSPIQAGTYAFDQQHCGLSNLGGCVLGGMADVTSAMQNVLASGLLAFECALLIFIAATGIYFLQFALKAWWLTWLADLAQPIVSTLQAMVNDFYVMPIGLLACTGYGGVIALTKGRGRGLGIIAGGLLIILLVYWLLSEPIPEMLGPNGVLSIGQYLGFMVAEGAVNNGALVSGNGAAQMGSLISLLCTALLREPIQMINFGTVVDDIPGCASHWNAAIMSGQVSGPANAMVQCGASGALGYANQLGLGAAGWFLVVIFVEFVIMLCLLYVGFHVIGIGFKAFFNLLVLVVAVPVGVAPGPPRRFAKRKALNGIKDGVEMFASTGGLSIFVIMIGSVFSGQLPGVGVVSSPLGKTIFVLVITILGAYGYHVMLVDLRSGHGMLHWVKKARDAMVKAHQFSQALDYLSLFFTTRSLTARRRHRVMTNAGIPPDEQPETKTSDQEYRAGYWRMPPGRTPPQPPGGGGGGGGGSGNTFVQNIYNIYNGGGAGGGPGGSTGFGNGPGGFGGGPGGPSGGRGGGSGGNGPRTLHMTRDPNGVWHDPQYNSGPGRSGGSSGGSSGSGGPGFGSSPTSPGFGDPPTPPGFGGGSVPSSPGGASPGSASPPGAGAAPPAAGGAGAATVIPPEVPPVIP